MQPWYVVYRWAWALYHLCWWVASLANEGGLDAPLKRKAYHFIYLTNWAYISIVVSGGGREKRRRKDEKKV